MMMKSVVALSVSALTVFGWATVPVAHAAPTVAADARGVIVLSVDVEQLPEEERSVGPVVVEQMRGILEDAGFEVAEGGEGTALRVRLRQMEAGDRNYGLHFEFVDGGEAEPAVEWTDCVFCTEARMLQKLESIGPDLVAAIDARGAGGTEVEADVGEDEDGGTGAAGPPPKPIGALGYVGVGAASLGIGATIAGAVEISRGVVVESDGNEQRDRIDHRSPGIALVGVGVTVMVVGLAILAVDLGVRAKKRKLQAPRAQTRLFPIFTHESVGLGVFGTF